MAGNVHEATVVDITTLARAVVRWRFRVEPPDPLRFRPGQFVSLRVGDDGDGAAVLRSYSIASAPGQDTFDLILKLVDGGTGSAWFQRLRPGDGVRFTGPMGFFVNDLQHGGDVVFAATGVGITPVLPMIEELLARENETGKIVLYWGNRAREDVFWRDELEALATAHARFQPKLFLTQPDAAWSGERGRITPAVLDDLATYEKPTFYLVGNGAMIRELKKGLMDRGVDRKRQIRNEAFFE